MTRTGSLGRGGSRRLLADLQLDGYEGGPFADRSGGLIVSAADSVDHAGQLVGGDPFVRHGLLADRWVKQWMA